MVFIVSRRGDGADDDVDGRIKATKYFHHCSPIKSEKRKSHVAEAEEDLHRSNRTLTSRPGAADVFFGVCRDQLLTQR